MATVVFGAAFSCSGAYREEKRDREEICGGALGKRKGARVRYRERGEGFMEGKRRRRAHAPGVVAAEGKGARLLRASLGRRRQQNKTKQNKTKQKLRVGLDWTRSVWPEKGRRVFQIC
jgi:hypothetical protein